MHAFDGQTDGQTHRLARAYDRVAVNASNGQLYVMSYCVTQYYKHERLENVEYGCDAL